jgi:O-methyltransferase domain
MRTSLRFVIHDWPDRECVRILTNIRAGLRGSGKVLLVENLLPPPEVQLVATTPTAGGLNVIEAAKGTRVD